MSRITVEQKHSIRRDSNWVKKQRKEKGSFVNERFHRSNYKPNFYLPQTYKIIQDETDQN